MKSTWSQCRGNPFYPYQQHTLLIYIIIIKCCWRVSVDSYCPFESLTWWFFFVLRSIDIAHYIERLYWFFGGRCHFWVSSVTWDLLVQWCFFLVVSVTMIWFHFVTGDSLVYAVVVLFDLGFVCSTWVSVVSGSRAFCCRECIGWFSPWRLRFLSFGIDFLIGDESMWYRSFPFLHWVCLFSRC